MPSDNGTQPCIFCLNLLSMHHACTPWLQTGSGSDDMRRVGARVLANLDRFALRAFNDMEQPELKIEGLSEFF